MEANLLPKEINTHFHIASSIRILKNVIHIMLDNL